jgi:hypothetical protein
MPRLKPIRGTLVKTSHPLVRGLVGCWLLGEGTGQTVADLGPYRQHGSYCGSSPLWKPGRHGYCFQFNGTDECIDCGTNKFGWDLTNELSVIALANHAASQVNTVFARCIYVRPVRLYGQAGGKFGFSVYTDTENDCIIKSTSYHATDGSEWVHVAGTWKPHGAYLYVNGVQEASDTTTDGNLNVLDNQFVGIGGTYEGGNFLSCWNGGIEYVFIYNRALSTEEVQWLYQDPFAMFDSSVSPAPVHAPISIVSLAGSIGAASATLARLESISSSAEIEVCWLNDALFNGMTANAFKLGTILSLGWFWFRLTGCCVLYRGPAMDRIDFDDILAIVYQDAETISPPCCLPHKSSSTYFYVMRRFSHCGNRELTLTAAAKVSIEANGEMAKPRPNKVLAFKIEPADGNKVRLTWLYCSLDQQSQPARFNVYCDSGTGQMDFENALATIEYKGSKRYSYTSDTLEPGRYLFTVKAEDVDGVQGSSSARSAIELDATSPEGIDILAVETA